MDVNTLVGVFAQSLSPLPEPRRQAEAFLRSAAGQPGFGLAILQVLMVPTAELEAKQAAAVSFKNYVKYHWEPPEGEHGEPTKPRISDAEKSQVKSLIINVMLGSHPRVRAQLSEALTIISSHDFPSKWPSLLPELVTRLASPDRSVIVGVLETTNSICKRFRQAIQLTPKVNEELKQCQEAMASPLLAIVRAALAALAGGEGGGEGAAQLLQALRLSFRIYYSLNIFGMTDIFDEALKDWMEQFRLCLTLPDALGQTASAAGGAGGAAPSDRETPLDAARAAVCAAINLLMEKLDEDEFAPYLTTFVHEIWGLLIRTEFTMAKDNLAMQAIRFLTSVSKSVQYTLFADEKVLRQICELIVIPNLKLREEDIELFDSNWIEYLRADMEGSDAETRRRAASDLIRSLVERFPPQVTALCSGYVGAMLAEYAASRERNWRAKDCALYLVMSLTVKGKTQQSGATQVNDLVSIPDFFALHVAPELQGVGGEELPVIKADALKFFATFRGQIPKDVTLSLLPPVISLLLSESNVVHSYAANLIERLLVMRNTDGTPRFTPADLAPVLQPLLENLFAALSLPESEENEYLVKCIMRVVSFLGPQAGAAAPVCTGRLAEILLKVCANPRNPGFNHYLFEAVAALVRNSLRGVRGPGAAAGGPGGGAAASLEAVLFPAFNVVLQQDVQEFAPYVFQILSLLLELRPPPIPPVYLSLLPPMLSPVLWERTGNVPALVRLCQAYLRRLPNEVLQGGQLLPTLGVFQKLIASKGQDHEGFRLLSAIVSSLPPPALEPHLSTIWGLLFTRLQNSKTNKFLRGFISFFGQAVVVLGTGGVRESIEKLQPGLFNQVYNSVVLGHLSLARSHEDEKLFTAAAAVPAADLPQIYEDSAALRHAIGAATALLSREGSGDDGDGGGGGGDEEAEAGLEGAGGYSAAYARLANAQGEGLGEVMGGIGDARDFLAQCLGRLGQKAPGRVGGAVGGLGGEQQAALAAWIQKAGVMVA